MNRAPEICSSIHHGQINKTQLRVLKYFYGTGCETIGKWILLSDW